MSLEITSAKAGLSVVASAEMKRNFFGGVISHPSGSDKLAGDAVILRELYSLGCLEVLVNCG